VSFRFSVGSSHQQAFIFSRILGTPRAQIVVISNVTQDHLNSTSAYAPTVGYQQHTDSTILRYSIFNSTTVFFAEIFAWASRPGLILKLSSPTRHHGIWWHIFTVYNSHSFVYLLWLNVL